MNNISERYVNTINYLGELFEYFNKELFKGELPKPVITIQPDMRNKENGWFSDKKVWLLDDDKDNMEYELNLSAQFLNGGMIEISQTLLHLMCHEYAKLNSLNETSRSGKYHNKLYKHIAETHGLNVDVTDKQGYSKTRLTDETLGLLNKYVEKNNYSCIHRLPMQKGKSVRRTSTRKYVCSECGNSVRATKEVNILCMDCNNPMVEEKL